MWKWVRDAHVSEIQSDETAGNWWSCCCGDCCYACGVSSSFRGRSGDDWCALDACGLQARPKRRRMRRQRQLRLRWAVHRPRRRSGRAGLRPGRRLRYRRPVLGSGRRAGWYRMSSGRRLRLRPRINRPARRRFVDKGRDCQPLDGESLTIGKFGVHARRTFYMSGLACAPRTPMRPAPDHSPFRLPMRSE
jgi:hypothetical protein